MPALSGIVPGIEKAGLLITGIEVLRLHYAGTLAAWRRNFEGACGKAASTRFDIGHGAIDRLGVP